MDLALNNLQRLICHKTQTTNQPTNQSKNYKVKIIIIKNSILTIDRVIGLMSRVFANGHGDQGSIPGRVIRNNLKMVLDASLVGWLVGKFL